MIKFENTEVFGWKAAIHGMRQPFQSHSQSDSHFDKNVSFIGENDYKLMMNLCKAGTDHRKFMRMIIVYTDIVAPLYWTAEHDTYKIGTVRNSSSFMHRGLSKKFDINDFSIQDNRIYYLLNPLDNQNCEPSEAKNVKVALQLQLTYDSWKNNQTQPLKHEYIDLFATTYTWEKIIEHLNLLRDIYLKTKDDNVFKEIRQLLPQGYNYRYTWMSNYEVLTNIYHSRKSHRLDEWRKFCKWIEMLPYSELITYKEQ